MPYYCFEAEPKSNQCLHFLSSTYELWESSIFLSKRERLSNEFVFLLVPSTYCGGLHVVLYAVFQGTSFKKTKQNKKTLPLICSLKTSLSHKTKLSLKY